MKLTQETGKIIKVSGPLVVATGIKDAKMYDIVRVSEKKLIGEIIEIRGDKIYIQVYEDTSGIGVNEPVYTTGAPLSVELGPGLITSIYDGIQRPLDKIKDETGDFITRGVEISGLDKKRKWKFRPLVKPGEEVSGGSIIGEVDETVLVKHKILVPPDISGKILKISEGEFTIEDTIAILKTKTGEEISLKMYHKWPVRQPRPYFKKVAPNVPLFTGQRVIDAFFPVAKGGTACVPGPFGSGKCVTGDTPVLLGNGKILPIKDIFEQYKDKGKKVINNHEVYITLQQPLEVFTYKDGKIKSQKATTIYKGKSDRIIYIKTRTGRKCKITPEHKLLKIDEKLQIVETEAKKLKIGDYIISPRKLEIDNTNLQNIKDISFNENYRVKSKHIFSSIKKIIDELTKKYGSKKTLAKKLNISYDMLIGYYLSKNNPTISFIKNLYSLCGYNLPEIKKIKAERQSKEINIPTFLDTDFAIFLGLLYSDGSIKKNTIIFYNNELKILKLYSSLAKKLFNIKTVHSQLGTVKAEIFSNKIIADLLKNLGYPEYKKSINCFVPEKIFFSPQEIIGAFLGAYYICDGYFNTEKKEIEIVSASDKMSRDLLYLCLRLGILARVKEKVYKDRIYYRIIISGKDEIENFYHLCNIGNYKKLKKIKLYLDKNKTGYSSIDVVPIDPTLIKKLYTDNSISYKTLKEKKVEIHNYLNGKLMSKRIFTIFSQHLNNENIRHFAFNHLNSIYCDKIVEIKEIALEENEFVYDLEVPQGHNFIGGFAPMFYHNTVIQHQLAKWADAEIVVYVGCGERGNEMTDVLNEFPELKDPKSGQPLMLRTVLIANTSNMPVAAREASIYTGITIAEYFRDMGYSVALMADSTSRWAEALREISGRLEEMPGEEGYPAYLPKRLAEFYERAGRVILSSDNSKEGALSVIGAVSPPGGDLSDPVVQGTLKVVKVFWSLEDWLAHARHFPAINWLTSYSQYHDELEEFYLTNLGDDWTQLRTEAMSLLQKESELKEIVRLVGMDALSDNDKLILESAKSIREDFLYQSAFDPVDTYASGKKQYLMLKTIITFYREAKNALEQGKQLEKIILIPSRKEIPQMRFTKEQELQKIQELQNRIIEEIRNV